MKADDCDCIFCQRFRKTRNTIVACLCCALTAVAVIFLALAQRACQ